MQKILTLLQQLSDEIQGMKNFFTEDGEYYFKVDMGGGDKFSIVDFYYNTVDYMVGTFKTSTSPNSGIFVRDILKAREGETANICFTRNAGNNNLEETEFDITFTAIDRPGRGGDENDFSLSSDTVSFDEGDTEKCVELTAVEDKHFDWITELRFNLTEPSSGEELARDNFLVRIYDSSLSSNRLNGIPNPPGSDMPLSGEDS